MAIAARAPADAPAPPRVRVTGLDLARSIAILGMFYAHFGGSVSWESGSWQDDIVRFTDGRAMPLFVVLSGCGLAFLLVRARRPWREVVGRAILLLLVGLAFESTQRAAVILQYYAVFFVAAVPLRRLATKWLLPAAATVVALGAVAQLYLLERFPDPYEFVGETEVVGELRLLRHPLALASSLFVNGVYPFFPTFAFVLVGMWIARHDLGSSRFRRRLVVVGALVAALGYGVGWSTQSIRLEPFEYSELEWAMIDADSYGLSLSEYADTELGLTANSTSELTDRLAVEFGETPETIEAAVAGTYVPELEDEPAAEWWLLDQSGHSNMPAWMLAASGLSAAVIGLALFLADRARRLTSPFVALGQLALTAYVAHLALFRWPLRNWPWGFEPTEGVALVLGGWLAVAAAAWAWRLRFRHGPLEAVVRAAGRAASWSIPASSDPTAPSSGPPPAPERDPRITRF